MFQCTIEISAAIHLKNTATETQGFVLCTYHTRGGDTSESYHVAYQYQVGAATYQGTTVVTQQQMQELKKGDAISIFYSYENPENSKAFCSFVF